MSASLPPILVLGGTGRIGSEVIRLLVSHSPPVSVTAGVRNLDKAKASLPSQAKLVHADFTNAASIGAAVNTSHAKKVFIYNDGVNPEVLSALKSAGITHIVSVLTSIVGLFPAASNPIVARCERLEREIQETGLTYTILRAEAFQSNALLWKYGIAKGVVKMVYPDAPIAVIASDDIAAVAVQALTSNKLDNKKVNIIGPAPITQRQQLAIISQLLGKPVQVETTTPEAFIAETKGFARFPEAVLQYQKFRQENGGEVQSKVGVDLEVKGKVHFQQWIEKHVSELQLAPQ